MSGTWDQFSCCNTSQLSTNSSLGINNSSYDPDLQSCLQLFDFQTPLPEKTPHVLRVFYNNCNGTEINKTIATYLRAQRDKIKYCYIQDIESPTKIDSIIRQMRAWSVDIAGLSEFGVAWEDTPPRRIIQQITKAYDPTSCWTVSSSAITVGNFLKPGGTGILTMNEYPGRIKQRGSDPWKLGRWSYVTLTGKDNCSDLTIITGYRPGKRSTIPGASTAWSQQRTLLRKENREDDPHDAFLHDLESWMSQDQFMTHNFLVMLDANEQWTDTAAIKHFSMSLNLRSVNEIFGLQYTHPNIIHPNKGTTIDFCFCSEQVLENISYASSTPYDLDTLGDHRGILIDINIRHLLGIDQTTTHMSSRKLTLSNPRAVENYLKAVKTGFTKQNLFKRAAKLYKRVNVGTQM